MLEIGHAAAESCGMRIDAEVAEVKLLPVVRQATGIRIRRR